MATFSAYRTRLALVAVVIIIGTYLLIATSFYLTATSVGAADTINSIYGRYFLPLFPLLAIFPMVFRQKYYASKAMTVYVPITVSLIALTSTIMSIQ